MKPKQICEVVKNGKLTAEQAKELLDFAGDNSHAFAEIMLLLKGTDFSTGVNAKISALFDEVVGDYLKLPVGIFEPPILMKSSEHCVLNANEIQIITHFPSKSIRVWPIYKDNGNKLWGKAHGAIRETSVSSPTLKLAILDDHAHWLRNNNHDYDNLFSEAMRVL